MSGSAIEHPEHWRKAKFLRYLGREEASTGLISHDHAEHVHGPDCRH